MAISPAVATATSPAVAKATRAGTRLSPAPSAPLRCTAAPLLCTLALSAPARALSEQLVRRFSRLVIGHGRALETRGHWREAADVYEQGLARDSLAEPIYRALMRVLLQLGERAEAMRTFARCRDLLTSALGVTPSHETWALREQAAGPQP